MSIKVLIIDDHNLFRSGIRSLLQRHAEFEVVGEAGNAQAGVELATQLRPDVVLMDLHMPGLSGVEAVALLTERQPDCHIIMLTVSEDADDLLRALQAGAVGYLLKNIETETLIDSLFRAAEGKPVISHQMTSKLIQSVRSSPERASSERDKRLPEREKLSVRETEILGLLATGRSNKEIARDLEVSEGTVKMHVQNIFKKLNITSRVQAAVYAVEHVGKSG